jgi:hypothetical protein
MSGLSFGNDVAVADNIADYSNCLYNKVLSLTYLSLVLCLTQL